MKRFIIITLILLLGLFYFGLPGFKNSDKTSSLPHLAQSTYSPWSNEWLEKLHRSFNLEEAVAYHIKKKELTSLEDIAPAFQQAVIVMEDRRFYDHIGIDWEGIIRAGLVNIQKGGIEEGASTITQQFAKNIFLTQEQHWSRKAEEIVLALQLEHTYNKEEIFTLYLNTVYFGSGAYGIQEASQTYFDKDPAILTLAESALLVGILPAPSAYSPHENWELAKQRQELVLDTMKKIGIITPRQAEEAKKAKIYIKPL